MSILSTKALLASLSIGGWDARKYDGKASKVVHDHFHATSDSGNFNKTLIDVKAESWVKIGKARTELREFHYAQTLPFVHKGAQILPAALYLPYNSVVLKLIDTYLCASDSFILNDYVNLKAQAKTKRNGLYHESDYPTQADLRRRFYAEVRYSPVPDAGHVLVDLHNKEVERIKADTEEMVQQAIDKAQAEVWLRLYEPVKNMADSLSDPTKRFHDTLVSNVKDIVKLAKPMNMVGDAKLNAMIEEIGRALTKASPEKLRTEPDVRAENARKAADLARRLRSLMPVSP